MLPPKKTDDQQNVKPAQKNQQHEKKTLRTRQDSAEAPTLPRQRKNRQPQKNKPASKNKKHKNKLTNSKKNFDGAPAKLRRCKQKTTHSLWPNSLRAHMLWALCMCVCVCVCMRVAYGVGWGSHMGVSTPARGIRASACCKKGQNFPQ